MPMCRENNLNADELFLYQLLPTVNCSIAMKVEDYKGCWIKTYSSHTIIFIAPAVPSYIDTFINPFFHAYLLLIFTSIFLFLTYLLP